MADMYISKIFNPPPFFFVREGSFLECCFVFFNDSSKAFKIIWLHFKFHCVV